MRRLAALLLAGAMALGLAGCGAGEADPSVSPDPEPTQTPRELPFALAYDPQSSLHPITGQSQVNLDLAGLVYEGLYKLDRDFVPQPALAQSAAVSGDGLVWTITLRAGVRFSDGTALTAAHVASSLETARASELYGQRLGQVTGVEAADDGTVRLTLSSPNGALDALLDIPIVLEQADGIPLGTGRYRFASGQEGLILQANEHYDRQVPYETIALRSAGGADERLAAFDSGDVTAVATDFSSSYALGYSGNYETYDFPTTTLLYVGFRTTGGLCASAQVRQALSKAFDREELVSALLAGHGDAASLPISPLHQDYDVQAAQELDYDLPGGRALLLEAGYTQGEDGRFYRGSQAVEVTIVVNNDSAAKQELAQFLADSLAALGVGATVSALPWEEYLAALSGGQFDLYVGEVRMTGDFDPTALLAGGLNYGGYTSSTGSALLADWRGAQGTQRSRAAAQLWDAFAQDAPIAPLCFKRGSLLVRWGMARNIQPTQADLFWNLEQWQVEESGAPA
ncbi:MAG TPA: ABC transporter substrate-binding protein [Firmicutes bacterium]|nr:ABC transporter substrate-binding protein [Bacillota bacterium]